MKFKDQNEMFRIFDEVEQLIAKISSLRDGSHLQAAFHARGFVDGLVFAGAFGGFNRQSYFERIEENFLIASGGGSLAGPVISPLPDSVLQEFGIQPSPQAGGFQSLPAQGFSSPEGKKE